MKRSVQVLLVLAAMGGFFAAPAKSDYVFQPDDADVADFDHGYVYLWKIDLAGGLAPGEVLTGAELFIDNINNTSPWTSNEFHIHLGDDDPINQAYAAAYIHRVTGTGNLYRASDPLPHNDTLSGYGVWLTTYNDTNGSATFDLTHSFTPSQLNALAGYLADGSFGIGFDPDCHFTNSGVKLTLHTETPVMPAPGAIVLGGLGTGLIGWLRGRRTF